MKNLKFDYKHFFTSVKLKTQKMAKMNLFSQKVKPIRILRIFYGCSMIIY